VGGLYRFKLMCDVAYLHLADNPNAAAFVCFWTKADKSAFSARDGLSAYDSKQTWWPFDKANN